MSISVGDFVEIMVPHVEAGHRGYVKNQNNDGSLLLRTDSTFFGGHCNAMLGIMRPLEHLLTKSMCTMATVPVSCIRIVRQHETTVVTRICDYISAEFPCLAVASSSLSTDMTILHSETPHGRLRRVSIQELPGLHSDESVFESSEIERIFRSVYEGNFVVNWKHSFKPPSSHNESDIVQEWMLDAAKPMYSFEVLVAGAREAEYTVLGTVTYTPPQRICDARTKRDGLSATWLSTFSISRNQNECLTLRILHLLMRITGYDFSYSSLNDFKLIFDQFKARNWWKENLDISLIWSDISIQQPTIRNDLAFISFTQLGEALEAVKKYTLAADIYRQGGKDYADPDSDDEFSAYNKTGLA
ncbi:hypothetical protein MPSEU_000984900 [Mayamaea pseudoterrestris]|nr:hypothetical protein MPSEU_000984900 [Mayamaea pseudoterrestris]